MRKTYKPSSSVDCGQSGKQSERSGELHSGGWSGSGKEFVTTGGTKECEIEPVEEELMGTYILIGTWRTWQLPQSPTSILSGWLFARRLASSLFILPSYE